MKIINEIDAIAASREINTNGTDLVNELLSQMDGMDTMN
ncbi:AAA family ATPase [Bacillus thuringiensis]|nr:AAA family ATPase [Bacillus thuringiensis]